METDTRLIRIAGKVEIPEDLLQGEDLEIRIGSWKTDSNARMFVPLLDVEAEVVKIEHHNNQDGTEKLIFVVKMK